jgi:hypothetical protein
LFVSHERGRQLQQSYQFLIHPSPSRFRAEPHLALATLPISGSDGPIDQLNLRATATRAFDLPPAECLATFDQFYCFSEIEHPASVLG